MKVSWLNASSQSLTKANWHLQAGPAYMRNQTIWKNERMYEFRKQAKYKRKFGNWFLIVEMEDFIRCLQQDKDTLMEAESKKFIPIFLRKKFFKNIDGDSFRNFLQRFRLEFLPGLLSKIRSGIFLDNSLSKFFIGYFFSIRSSFLTGYLSTVCRVFYGISS